MPRANLLHFSVAAVLLVRGAVAPAPCMEACDDAAMAALRDAEGPGAAPHVALASSANPEATAVYDAMMPRFAELEAAVASKAGANL